MRAAWYEKQGPASEVLNLGEMPDPKPHEGEVRIRISASGINPGDVKKRQDRFGVGMPYSRVIPHSDGAGIIDMVGPNVSPSRIGERVWCYGAQSYRPFGTAAEYTVVNSEQAVPLSPHISFEQGACLGIPGITAHRAVHIAGRVKDRTILVQGGAGAVGQCAIGLARHAGAQVIATVRSEDDELLAARSGAHHVVRTDELSASEVVKRIKDLAQGGIDHIVEVAFHANILPDEQLLALGGSIATYATGEPSPTIPFWPLVFKNVRVLFLGSDDFPLEAKTTAAADLNDALKRGWPGFEISERFPLDSIAKAHDVLERQRARGRVVLTV